MFDRGGDVQRLVEGDDERQGLRRQTHVDAGRGTLDAVAGVGRHVRAQPRVRHPRRKVVDQRPHPASLRPDALSAMSHDDAPGENSDHDEDHPGDEPSRTVNPGVTRCGRRRCDGSDRCQRGGRGHAHA